MSTPEPSFSVNVDVANPGQFFACCGLLELAHRLWPGTEGWFENGAFCVVLAAASPERGINKLIRTLSETTLVSDESRGERATHPVHFEVFGLMLDWWLDGGDWTDSGHSPFKMWAGQQTAIGIVEQLRTPLSDLLTEGSADSCLDLAIPLTGRFGFDPRSAWRAIDAGFSPNEQGIEVGTYPAVELLAAVGLQVCRPRVGKTWQYVYSTWSSPLPAHIAPAAALGKLPLSGRRDWAFRIVKRGSYKGLDQSIPWEPNNHD
ncbi:MAG: hypothetical protein IID44_21945 [Planctomycetes bacterium]|nr:hypothetical protein [Planctomycetota bacterium]